MGFRHVSFPATLMFRMVGAMEQTLAALRRYADGREGMEPAAQSSRYRQILDEAVDLARWQGIEAAHASSGEAPDRAREQP
jgi:hypothetical protein